MPVVNRFEGLIRRFRGLVLLAVALVVVACTGPGTGTVGVPEPGDFTIVALSFACLQDETVAVTVTWTEAANAATFEVFRNGASVAELAAGSRSHHDLGTLAAGSDYEYSVQAVNTAGRSETAAETLAVASGACDTDAPPTPPGPVQLDSATAQCGPGGEPILALAWSSSAQATSYQVERDYSILGTVGQDVHEYSDGNVEAYGDYTYVIRARNDSGLAISEPLRVTVPWRNCATIIGPAVAAGERHALAIAPDGTVWSWGSNWSMELGRGHDEAVLEPGKVLNLSGIVAVAAGTESSYALDSAGHVWFWGYRNSGGTIASVTTQSHAVPVRLQDLSEIVALAAGDEHALALAADGSVYAWGANHYGQLGIGHNNYFSDQPVLIETLDDVIAVAAGSQFSLALDSTGNVWAWGSNQEGQLAIDSLDYSGDPLMITGMTAVRAIAAAGNHAVALDSGGTLHGWGSGESGQLGSNLAGAVPSPLSWTGDEAISVAAGENSTLAILADGSVLRWGSPGSPQNWDDDHEPQLVPGVTDVVEVAAGGNFMLAVTAEGSVFAWGRNDSGQLGTDREPEYWDLSRIDLSGPVISVAIGEELGLALLQDGSLYSWGSNRDGELGIGLDWLIERAEPVQIPALSSPFASVSAYGSHAIAVLEDGTVWTWGTDSTVVLGRAVSDDSNVPVQVPGLSGVVQAAAAAAHSLVLASDGTVYSWGRNWSGQLGVGNYTASSIPLTVTLPQPATAIAVGDETSFALLEDGTVMAWGSGHSGALGNGATSSQISPVPVDLSSFSEPVVALSAGGNHSLALLQDGTVIGWGDNWAGQLGVDGHSSSSPVIVPDLEGIAVDAIAAGAYHSLALQNGVGVYGWGMNSAGELPGVRPGPVQFPMLLAGTSVVTGVAAGHSTSFLLTATDLFASGSDAYGALGQGRLFWSRSALQVPGVVAATAQ